MATMLSQRAARPLLSRQCLVHGTRSLYSQYGFCPPFPPEHQQRQAPQAFSPIPYVTESIVCCPPAHQSAAALT
jgi:hypothetical protein